MPYNLYIIYIQIIYGQYMNYICYLSEVICFLIYRALSVDMNLCLSPLKREFIWYIHIFYLFKVFEVKCFSIIIDQPLFN